MTDDNKKDSNNSEINTNTFLDYFGSSITNNYTTFKNAENKNPPHNWIIFILKQLDELLEQLEQLKKSKNKIILNYYKIALRNITDLIKLFKNNIYNSNNQKIVNSYFSDFININYQIRVNLSYFNKEEIMFAVNTSSKMVMIERIYNYLVYDSLDFKFRKIMNRSRYDPSFEQAMKEKTDESWQKTKKNHKL